MIIRDQIGRLLPCFAVLAIVCATPASAFTKIGADWTYKLPTKPMGEKLEICLTNAPAGASAAIKAAAAKWKYAKFEFSFATDACHSNGAFPSQNDVNQVDFGTLPNGAGAGATKPYADGSRIVECDIRFNSSFTWNTSTGNPTTTQSDLISVALHELGHCLGLGEVTNPFQDPTPVMYFSIEAGEKRRDLTTDDTDGRADIYGP